MTRLLCLKAADMMDKVGNKAAQLEIAMIKVAAPNMALKIIDDAIQAYGGAGVTDDFGLAKAYAGMRTLRLADGPDEVHNRAIARLEFGSMQTLPIRTNGSPSGVPRRHSGMVRRTNRNIEFRVDARMPGMTIENKGASLWPRASETTRNFPAPGRSRSAIGSTRSRLDGWMREQRRGLSGTADGPAVQGRPVQPDLPARYAGPLLRDAPQAVRQAAAVGACGRPRVPVIAALQQAGLSGRQDLRAVHRRQRHRRLLLHHVHGRGPGVLGSDAAEPDAGRAPHDLHQQDRDAGEAAHLRSARRSGSATSASPATTSPARSTAGPSSTGPPRPSTSPSSSG